MVKTCSVSTAPASSSPNSSVTSVTMGMSALRSACRSTTLRAGTPLARAVRT